MSKTLRNILVAATVATGSIVLAAPAIAEAPVYTSKFSNVAVQGYDPVAYFTVGEPTKGSSKFTTEYNGAEFQFASQENLNAFLASPTDYAPQYGGYCAWAIASGKYAKGNAKHWAIVDGKLYLNYNASIQSKWNADQAGFISNGDVQWAQLQGVSDVAPQPQAESYGSGTKEPAKRKSYGS